jgi:phosphoglycolate phosphatase-like HAD superfamily hydrolase
MAIAPRHDAAVRAVIFDLDEALLARGEAWRYAVEEAVISVTSRRVDARGLVAEYHRRPWAHALAVLLEDAGERGRCAELCTAMFERSAMKRLLIHDGLGMALDQLRGERVETGAISREPHARARRQIESTGLERFVSVLSATPAGGRWEAGSRLADCLAFIEQPAGACAFVSGDGADLQAAEAAGFRCYEASWAATEPTGFEALEGPAVLARVLHPSDVQGRKD